MGDPSASGLWLEHHEDEEGASKVNLILCAGRSQDPDGPARPLGTFRVHHPIRVPGSSARITSKGYDNVHCHSVLK